MLRLLLERGTAALMALLMGVLLVGPVIPHHCDEHAEAVPVEGASGAAIVHGDCSICDLVLPGFLAAPAIGMAEPEQPMEGRWAPCAQQVLPAPGFDHKGRGPPEA